MLLTKQRFVVVVCFLSKAELHTVGTVSHPMANSATIFSFSEVSCLCVSVTHSFSRAPVCV